jgi:2'-5' RNA ligase
MPEQFNLPGFEAGGPSPPRPRPKPAPRRPHRAFTVFFAIRPAPDDARTLEVLGQRLAQDHGLRCEFLAADRLHVSLHNLGEYDAVPAGLVQRASQVADALVFPAFKVVFDKAVVFRSRGAPYVLCGGEGLNALRQFRLALGMAMADLHMPVLHSFTPHMTLAYKGRLGLVHAIAPVCWPAYELVLINSHYGKTVHEVLGRWPLARS